MDGETYFRFLAALVFVLALIALVTWLVRRFGLASGLGVRTGSARRLRVREAISIDAKHRLVLVRRDDVEHLLLIGPGAGTLVESGIAAPPDDAAASGASEAPSFKAHIARFTSNAGRGGER